MADPASDDVADAIETISRDLEAARYELETVRDREEAARVVRRVEERIDRLAGCLGVGSARDLSV